MHPSQKKHLDQIEEAKDNLKDLRGELRHLEEQADEKEEEIDEAEAKLKELIDGTSGIFSNYKAVDELCARATGFLTIGMHQAAADLLQEAKKQFDSCGGGGDEIPGEPAIRAALWAIEDLEKKLAHFKA